MKRGNGLIIAASGIVQRIMLQLQLVEKEGGAAAGRVDVNRANVAKFLSLCGLKLEKLSRSVDLQMQHAAMQLKASVAA